MNICEIRDPAFLRRMDEKELQKLCGELREFIIEGVSHTGGHLSSNLGLVELTVALHRVFEVPRDKLIFDVGHQCYTHKLLTGRQAAFGYAALYRWPFRLPVPGGKPLRLLRGAAMPGHPFQRRWALPWRARREAVRKRWWR